jgi:asparagine synthase (glutamine-hydrolysing)
VAHQYGTEHHEFVVKAKTVDVLPKLAWFFDEPFADPSAVPMYYVSQIAREHVTVALNGDGGDEVFAGYGKYLGAMLRDTYRKVPARIRRHAIAPLLSLLSEGANQKSLHNRWKRLNNLSLFSPIEANLRASVYNGLYPLREVLYTPAFLEAVDSDPLDHMRGFYTAADARDEIGRYQYTDLMTYLPDDLLVKADRMTMACGLEGRSPFLDHEIVEYAGTLPWSLKIRGRTLKYILRQVALGLGLPHDLVYRYKHGFEIPIADWLKEELRPMRDDLLVHSRFSNAGLLHQDAINRLMHEHDKGYVNHAQRLWALLNLELWCEAYAGSVT